MTDTYQTCSTCNWWNGAAPCKATMARDPSNNTFLGTCEINPPVVISGMGGLPTTVYPQTHAERSCGRWTEIPDFDDGDDGEQIDGGEPVVIRFERKEAA